MKIWIGGYRNHWNTQDVERLWYKWRYDKYDFEVPKKERDKYDHAFEAFADFWQSTVCRAVNWFKGKIPRIHIVKIDEYDTWSMDTTLTPIILPMLKQLREKKHGSPCTEDSDVPEHLRSTAAPSKENEWDTDENHFKRWDWIMDEMIWAFEQLNDPDSDDQFYTGESDLMFQAIDKNDNPIGEPHRIGEKSKESDDNDSVLGYLMVNGPRHTRVCDRERMTAHHARINNGLRLFGVYFRNLWD
jgi:hypothetical protein